MHLRCSRKENPDVAYISPSNTISFLKLPAVQIKFRGSPTPILLPLTPALCVLTRSAKAVALPEHNHTPTFWLIHNPIYPALTSREVPLFVPARLMNVVEMFALTCVGLTVVDGVVVLRYERERRYTLLRPLEEVQPARMIAVTKYQPVLSTALRRS